MAAALKWDTQQDAEVHRSILSGDRIVRTALVTGMDSSFSTPSGALIDVTTLTGVPDFGDPHPNYPSAVCLHKIARGLGGTLGRLWVHYERPGGGGTPLERFSAEDGVSLVNEPTNVFPGTATQMRCSLTSTSPNYESITAGTDRPITANFPAEWRQLVLFGLFADRPSDTVRYAARCVNNATWQGLNKGYWRCQGPNVRYSSRDGMFAVTVGFLNKGENPGEDWSTYEIPYGPTGEQVKVKSSILATLYAQPYDYGIRYDKNGIFKAGFYRLKNFSTIFGDDFPIGD